MDIPCKILSYFFVITTMLTIGLRVTGPEILSSLNDKRLIARVLMANIVLVPLLGIILAKIFHLSADNQVGIILLACAPGGVNAIQFTGKIRSHVAFAAGLLFLLNIVAVIVTPLMANAILPNQIQVTMPYLSIAGLLTFLMLLPLLAGFSIHQRFARLAEIIYTPLLILSNISFVAMIILTMHIKKGAMGELDVQLVIAMLLLIIGSMFIGWFLGGPDKGMRRVMATSTSMRNAALCIMLAVMGFPERNVDLSLLAFMALMVPPNMLFTVYHSIKEKRGHRPEKETHSNSESTL
jgi:bile acid:Na+ symporter, BASS family